MIRRPPNVTKEPVSPATRYSLIAGAVLLIVAAAVVNISHTRTNAVRLGQDPLAVMVIGLLPDFALPMSVARLRYYRRCPWGWAGVILSVTLIAWSALSGAQHGTEGQAMSLVCLAFAIVAAGQAHLPSAAPVGVLIAHVEALAEDATRTLEAAREDAAGTVRAVREEASAALAQASAETARSAVRVVELEASVDGLRTLLADAQRAVREASGNPSGKTARTRPEAVREPSGRTSSGTSDVQKYRAARDGYKASVRMGGRWPNEQLACALVGCSDACVGDVHRPESDALATARKRGSDWRREVDTEASGQTAEVGR